MSWPDSASDRLRIDGLARHTAIMTRETVLSRSRELPSYFPDLCSICVCVCACLRYEIGATNNVGTV